MGRWGSPGTEPARPPYRLRPEARSARLSRSLLGASEHSVAMDPASPRPAATASPAEALRRPAAPAQGQVGAAGLPVFPPPPPAWVPRQERLPAAATRQCPI